ncbi:MAG: PEP/pyruvate-binding domain-containing protein [Desulfatiglandales bacterium]
MDYILNFENLDKDFLPLVGGKNANLGEMIKADIRVPPGFAVTTDSYKCFINSSEVSKKIFKILSSFDTKSVDSLNKASTEIQDLVNSAPIPKEVEDSVREGYAKLCQRCSVEILPVAVRSSATAEDLPAASFAGQQDTYLWVQGEDKIIQDVRRCWASLFTARAIDYRIKNNFPHERVLISVGIQEMVNSRTAGVMFTLNPTNGDESKIVIEGNWGLGETVVSGSVNPDKFVVDKVVLETTERAIAKKHIKCVYDPVREEVVNIDVEEDMQNKCCLNTQEITELAKIANNIESLYGRAMDIEWAIDDDLFYPENIFVVQARPETVWSRKKKGPVIGKKSGHQLLMEQAMKRIKISY